MAKISMGYKYSESTAIQQSKPNNKLNYPGLHLDNPPSNFPSIKMGERIKAVVELELKSFSKNQHNGSATRSNYSFDIISMDIKDKSSKSDDDISDALKEEINSGDAKEDDD